MGMGERKIHAQAALEAYLKEKGTAMKEAKFGSIEIENYEVSDLICDLLHYARDKFEEETQLTIDRAMLHYEGELEDKA